MATLSQLVVVCGGKLVTRLGVESVMTLGGETLRWVEDKRGEASARIGLAVGAQLGLRVLVVPPSMQGMPLVKLLPGTSGWDYLNSYGDVARVTKGVKSYEEWENGDSGDEDVDVSGLTGRRLKNAEIVLRSEGYMANGSVYSKNTDALPSRIVQLLLDADLKGKLKSIADGEEASDIEAGEVAYDSGDIDEAAEFFVDIYTNGGTGGMSAAERESIFWANGNDVLSETKKKSLSSIFPEGEMLLVDFIERALARLGSSLTADDLRAIAPDSNALLVAGQMLSRQGQMRYSQNSGKIQYLKTVVKATSKAKWAGFKSRHADN